MLQLLKSALSAVQHHEREDSKSVLVARPNKTPPDYDALRAEVMNKFRKTLAYLAK
jgi:hypothetical protein